MNKTLNDAQIPDHKLNPATVSLWTDAEMLEWKRIAVMLLLYRLKMILITLSFNHQEEKPTSLFFYWGWLSLHNEFWAMNQEWYRLHNHLRRFLHFLNSAVDKGSLVTQYCGITGLPDSWWNRESKGWGSLIQKLIREYTCPSCYIEKYDLERYEMGMLIYKNSHNRWLFKLTIKCLEA